MEVTNRTAWVVWGSFRNFYILFAVAVRSRAPGSECEFHYCFKRASWFLIYQDAGESQSNGVQGDGGSSKEVRLRIDF